MRDVARCINARCATRAGHALQDVRCGKIHNSTDTYDRGIDNMNELLGREIAGLLFDADGTLLDTHDLILSSMRYTINEGCNESYSDAELMRGVGTPLPDQMLFFANGDAQKADELVITYRAHNDIIHDAGICTFPDTRAALERFRAQGLHDGRGHLETPRTGRARTGAYRYRGVLRRIDRAR